MMEQRCNFKSELKNAVYLLFGSIFLAGGVVLFLAPNQIATGGTPGLAILLHYLVDLPIGTLMIIINAPLLLVGGKLLGRAFAIRTVVAIFSSALFIDLFAEVLQFSALSNDSLLATLYGGIAVGCGVGLILRGNASAGGSTIIAKIITSRSDIKPGQVILVLDLLIIVSSALVFNNIERALWSLISIYATTKCIDMILTGAPTEKVVHIASNQVELLCQQIRDLLGEQGTVVTGTGLNANQEKHLIFVTVEARRIMLLRNIVAQTDPEALMVVMEASEIRGRGHGF